jgi:DNA-binding response OmpR family regulator
VPSPSLSNDIASFGGTILLIEEYGALSAALTSALKKFAPRHGVFTAASIGEAESSVQNVCPDLLIIDFDPAVGGVTDFLMEARKLCPFAKVIVMGAGVSSDLASDYRRFGAIHFVPKPFEISDFGAAVQALLGPAVEPRATLSSLGAADVVLAHCAAGRTTRLEVKGGNSGKTGEIHVIDGQIVHARTAKRKDQSALEEMFGWNEPLVEEQESAPVRRTIREDWAEIFLDAVSDAKPRPLRSRPAPVRVPQTAPPPPARPASAAKTGKKIVIIDDTEMLLVFVEDTLTLAEPQLLITTAPNGITGVKEIESLLPDLVLLDYSLPDINGDEVCRRLLANPRTARIPVVMMSGHIPEMTAAAEMFPNIVATIAKPFMSDALAGLVRQTLQTGLRPQTPSRPPQVAPARPVAAKEDLRPKAPQPPPVAAARPVAAPKTPPPPPREPPPRQQSPPVTRPLPVPVPPKATSVSSVPPAPPPRIAAPIRPPAPPPVQERPMEPHVRLRPSIAAPVLSAAGNEVVLGLFLDVVSMQLTPSLRMGAIRARPSSFSVSLHVSPAALQGLPVETGFELGPVELDSNHRIRTVRLIPTLQAFQRIPTRPYVQLGALNVVPQDSRDHVQLTPSPTAPMTMHLLAHLELGGVELSTNFQLTQLVLKARSTTVRVTLSSDAVGQEKTGVFCETAAVRVDQNGRIAEMLLKPLK